MSQPNQQSQNKLSLQIDFDEPGQISLSQLIKSGIPITEEKNHSMDDIVRIKLIKELLIDKRAEKSIIDTQLNQQIQSENKNDEITPISYHMLESKNASEQNQSKQMPINDPQSISDGKIQPDCLNRFKNETYRVRNNFLQKDSQSHHFFIPDIKETLQQDYENREVLSSEIANQDQIECEISQITKIQIQYQNSNCQIDTLYLQRQKNSSGEKQKQNNQTQTSIFQIETQIQSHSNNQQPFDNFKQKHPQNIDYLQKQTILKASSQIQKSSRIQQLSKLYQSSKSSMNQTNQQQTEHIDIDEIDNDTPVFGDLQNQTPNLETNQRLQTQTTPETYPIQKIDNRVPLHLSHPSEISSPSENDYQEKSNSKLPGAHPKSISIDDSEEQETIFVPKKHPSPTQTPVNPQQAQSTEIASKFSVEEVRKMLLEADTDWSDIIKNAPDEEILQFYYQLTNRSEIGSLAEHTVSPIVEQVITQQPQVPVEGQVAVQKNPKPQATQETIIEEKPFASFQLSENSQEELETLVQVLTSTSPELKQEIMKLSREELRILYNDTIKETKQAKSKSKKKKNNKSVIDLEDENEYSKKDSSHNENSQTSVQSNHSASQPQPQPKASFSYLTQHQKKRQDSHKKVSIVKPSTPILINKTLLYQLIRSHDFQQKLNSIMMPKESVKYQEKTQKQIAMLYLNHLKKKKIAKGPFEFSKGKQPEKGFVILCSKNSTIKNEQFKKMSKQGLGIEIPKITDEKMKRILELRQKRIQGSEQSQKVSQINTLPSSSVQLLPTPSNATGSSNLGRLMPQASAKSPGKRRYCLIVEEELDSREEEEIGLQQKPKRVKKSAGEMQDKEILSLLKDFEKMIGTRIELQK